VPLKLACLSTDWGRALHAAALARGINSTLIDSRATPTPASVLFCRPPQRDPSQAVKMAAAHIEAGGKCVQSTMDLKCYENRIFQMEMLEDFYPAGEIIRTMEWAEEACHTLGFPIVSKAPYGSSSATVRLLANKDEAMADARDCLQRGRQFRNWPTQFGVALWQKFLPGNRYALRVTQITDRLGWVFKVMNRAHDWRASGSGMCVPVTAEEMASPWLRDAVNVHLSLARRMHSRWIGTDLLYDRTNQYDPRWRAVDVTLAWTLKPGLIGGHWDAPVIDLYTLEQHKRADGEPMHGSDQWNVLLTDLREQNK
jgi:hypothetical protein